MDTLRSEWVVPSSPHVSIVRRKSRCTFCNRSHNEVVLSPTACRKSATGSSPSRGCTSSQWRSVRTTNAIERLHEEFKRRIKAQTVPPSADTAAMLFWALLASGQINMRKADGWQTLATKPIDQPIDLAA